MKKIACIVLVMIMATSTMFAQTTSNKFFQKVQGGATLATFASTTFSRDAQPFSLSYGLSVNTTIFTPRTYHKFMYGFGNNSFQMLHGYFLPKNWDAYTLYSKALNANQNYLAFGVEKMITAENVKYFLFSELGTDFKGTKILSFGVLTNLQGIFWKRE